VLGSMGPRVPQVSRGLLKPSDPPMRAETMFKGVQTRSRERKDFGGAGR